MQLEIGSLSSGGLVLGANPLELAPNIFSYVENVEFTRKGVRPLRQPISRNLPVPGNRLVLRAVDTLVNGGVRVVLLFCEDKVYALTGLLFTDVTPSGLLPSKEWSVAEFNGYVVACNGNNFPYYYDFASPESPMKVLPNWSEALVPKKLSSMSGFLIFMGLVSDGTFANQIIIWSDAAELGALPSNYNWADPTSRAGFYSLPDFEEFVAAELLNKSLIIYRTQSIYEMRFIGGTLVFSIEQRFKDKTLFSSRAVATRSRIQYCIGENEFYAHDSLADTTFDTKPISEYFFDNVNREYSYRVQMVYDASAERIHIFYPHGEATLCNRDLFFDFKTGCWSLAVLDGYSYVGTELISGTQHLTYEEANMSYEDSTDDFSLIYAPFSRDKLVYYNASIWQVGGESPVLPCMLARSIVAYNAQDQSGSVTVKRNLHVLVTEIWPKLSNGTLQFRLGFSQTAEGAVTWSEWQTAESNMRIDLFESGTYMHIEMRNQSQDFTLNGYMLNVANIGSPI